MTREEKEIALYCLKAYSDYHSEVCEECVKYPYCDHTIQDDVTETIIKALEQEPCDDCVSRQAVIGIIKRNCIPLPNTIKHLEDLPSVLPEREQGEWIEVHPLQEDDGGAYMCSKCKCGHPYIAPHWKYCPNCGAEMR